VEAAFGSGERGGEGKGEGRSGRGEGKNKWWWQQDKFGVTRHHVREQNKNGCCFSGEGCGAVTFYSTRENIVHRYCSHSIGKISPFYLLLQCSTVCYC
jgi:hypothetical protein